MSDDAGWSIKVRIPLGRLEWRSLPAGSIVPGNVRRNRWLGAEGAKSLGRQPRDRPIFSWTSMGGGGHNPERFGLFLFE